MSSRDRGDGRGWLVTRLLSSPLTARRAAAIISLFTLSLTLAAATLAFLLDREDFPNLGISIWWALQTVTTVGYGDFVPHNTEGRVIGGVVMLGGISFVAVVTASIAAALVEAARRRTGAAADEGSLSAQLEQISARLQRLEEAANRTGRAEDSR
ncbi:MAG: potassium channel family protein [Solirubrobacterales bacterium]